MSDIVLCADSTCDLNAELKERYHVHYFPYHISYEGRDYLDNVDIFPEDFYEGYYRDGVLPKTAAINVGEYLEFFRQFTDRGSEVIHINLASSLSSAHSNARFAADQLQGVHVLDSHNLSTGMGQLVIRAGKMIEEGMGSKEIIDCLCDLRPRVHSSFIMSTFDFLAAGGRCPAALAWAGKMASLKPGIVVNNADGSMSLGKMYRGKMCRVIPKYVHDSLDSCDGVLLDDVFLTYSGAMDEGALETAEAAIRECLPGVQQIHYTHSSCTISSHCGPNSLGVLFVTER